MGGCHSEMLQPTLRQKWGQQCFLRFIGMNANVQGGIIYQERSGTMELSYRREMKTVLLLASTC